MKSFKQLMSENLSEGHDRYPGDDMTQKELKIAINSAKNILDMIGDGASLMRWQISAIVKASDELASVCTTMRADEEEDEDEHYPYNPYDDFYEENESPLVESHFEVGDKVKCIDSGMKGRIVKVDSPEVGKYYTVRRDDGKMMKYAPDELNKL
jgi:hypothetical protein